MIKHKDNTTNYLNLFINKKQAKQLCLVLLPKMKSDIVAFSIPFHLFSYSTLRFHFKISSKEKKGKQKHSITFCLKATKI